MEPSTLIDTPRHWHLCAHILRVAHGGGFIYHNNDPHDFSSSCTASEFLLCTDFLRRLGYTLRICARSGGWQVVCVD